MDGEDPNNQQPVDGAPAEEMDQVPADLAGQDMGGDEMDGGMDGGMDVGDIDQQQFD